MKKDLLFACVLVVLAALGVGIVVVLPALQRDDDKPKTIKPKLATFVEPPKKAEPKKAIKLALLNVKERTEPIEQAVEPAPKRIQPEKKTPKKLEPKVDVEVKEENRRPGPKVIVFEPLTFLNDPDGEFTVKSLSGGKEVQLEGRIKTLKIAGLSERAVLDASRLVAREIIFTGNLNSGSKVILGKAQKLTIRDVNDKSLLDASSTTASQIVVNGSVNSQSNVLLHAPGGTVTFTGQVNDRSRVDITAPDGTVLFDVNSAVNGDSQLNIVAKEVDLRGAVNGNQTALTVTLTKAGSLKFLRLNGEARLHWRKADSRDPEPSIEAGDIGGRAQFRMLPAEK